MGDAHFYVGLALHCKAEQANNYHTQYCHYLSRIDCRRSHLVSVYRPSLSREIQCLCEGDGTLVRLDNESRRRAVLSNLGRRLVFCCWRHSPSLSWRCRENIKLACTSVS